MSIKKSDVQVKRTKGKGHITFEARLLLKNENIVSNKKISDSELELATDAMFDNLQMSIIAHIYGDLIEPINKIMRIVAKDIIIGKDREAAFALRQEIQDVIFGNEVAEPKEKEKKGVIKLLS